MSVLRDLNNPFRWLHSLLLCEYAIIYLNILRLIDLQLVLKIFAIINSNATKYQHNTFLCNGPTVFLEEVFRCGMHILSFHTDRSHADFLLMRWYQFELLMVSESASMLFSLALGFVLFYLCHYDK